MENRITILLQDEKLLEEILKDPDVLLKLKNSVIDRLGKRAVKIANVDTQILNSAKNEIETHFFNDVSGSRSFYKQLELKDKFKMQFRDIANKELQAVILDELAALRTEYRYFLEERKKEIMKKISEIDIESIIREVAEKVIKEKFK